MPRATHASVPAERGRERESSLVVESHVSILEPRGWSNPAMTGGRTERRKVGTLPNHAATTLPFWPTLPAASVGGPARSPTTTRATRSAQFGCCRLARWVNHRWLQPPAEKAYKISSWLALRSHLGCHVPKRPFRSTNWIGPFWHLGCGQVGAEYPSKVDQAGSEGASFSHFSQNQIALRTVPMWAL